MNLSVREILEATQGELLQGQGTEWVQSISTDSRTIQKGEYFLCLIGENFDGHQFVAEVIAKGAGGLILDEKHKSDSFPNKIIPIIAVKDTSHALGNIARAWRRKFDIPLLAVGGSNGKTSTKDMCAAVFASQFKTLATEGNLNNLIGVPKMLFKLDKKYEAAVIEMGMNEFGEMARLTEITEPTLALLTNTGFEHVEKMKSLEGVAQSNGEMFAKLPSGALALVNADDEYIPKMPTRAYKISFGMEKPADVFCEKFDLKEEGIYLEVSFRGKAYPFEVPVHGKANVRNALAAIAAGFAMGIDPKKIKQGLASYRGRSMRMEVLNLKQGVQILNDCYNANPSSMMAALETLLSLKKNNSALAILGEMRELGDFAEEGHRLVGEAVAKNKINRLISIGPFASQMVEVALAQGMDANFCKAFSKQEDALETILSWLPECKSILIKGSRGAKMEKITEFLKEKLN